MVHGRRALRHIRKRVEIPAGGGVAAVFGACRMLVGTKHGLESFGGFRAAELGETPIAARQGILARRKRFAYGTED
jgi:hypothetical protein